MSPALKHSLKKRTERSLKQPLDVLVSSEENTGVTQWHEVLSKTVRTQRIPSHLCGGEEDVVRYVANSAGYDAQSHSGEYIGVVSLSGVEAPPISQRHLAERTPAGEDAPPLIKKIT